MSASRPWLRHPAPPFCRPVTAAPRRVPNGKTTALVAIRLHFACGETALAGHRPHRGRCFAVPVTAAPRRGPNGKNPALFGYFLNIKKVTPSADFVIGPAKAEAFLFSHTRLPFPPRPLLPFGRISPAAKPRVRSSAPPFGFAAQNQARHFAARNRTVCSKAPLGPLPPAATAKLRSTPGKAIFDAE